MNLLNDSFHKYRDNIYIILPDIEDEGLTYGQVNSLSAVFAGLLKMSDVVENDRVCIITGNKIQFIIAYFAILKLKAIPIAINIRLNVKEVGIQFNNCNPKKVVILPTLFKKYSELLTKKNTFLAPSLNDLKQWSLYNTDKGYETFPDRKDEELLTISYTSGTTGTPKGAMLKHNGWLRASKKYGELLQLSEQTRIMQALPLWQADGCIATVTLPVLHGSSVVLVEPFDEIIVNEYFSIVDKYRANYLFTVPAILSRLLLLAQDGNIKFHHNVKYAKVSSSVLLPEVKNKFQETFGIKVMENYGSTEGNAITVSDPNDDDNGSVGKITGICELKVNKKAELLIKNQEWFAGYYNNQEKTNEAFEDGWFKMIDVVEIKRDYIYLLGRTDDIMNKFGEKISPSQIDDVIVQFESVYESVTIGYKNEVYNDDIYSFIVLKNADKKIYSKEIEKKIIDFCSIKLPPHKVPTKVFIVDEIPVISSGKPDKKKLLELLKDRK